MSTASETTSGSERHPVIVSDGSVAVWMIERDIADGNQSRALERVSWTLRPNEKAPPFSINDYVADRAGWVSPLLDDFTRLLTDSQKRDPIAGDSGPAIGGLPVVTEALTIAGIRIRIRAFQQTMGRSRPTKDVGEEVARKLKLGSRKLHERAHAVVWFQPKADHVGNAERLAQWLNACSTSVSAVMNEQLPETALKWVEVGGWLSVIHTPRVTFATWTSNKKAPELTVIDARVRHLVVDPAVLATAQYMYAQETVAHMAEIEQRAHSREASDLRKSFYMWRSRNWWTQPAIAPLANRVWRGCVDANNTVAQIEGLSREMVDYANVEEIEHHQRVERHNQRLAWGALTFAVLAIAITIYYEEGRQVWIVAAAILITGLTFGAWITSRQWVKWKLSNRNRK